MLSGKKYNGLLIELPMNPDLEVNKFYLKKALMLPEKAFEGQFLGANQLFILTWGTRLVTALIDFYVQRSITNKNQVVLICYYALPSVGIEEH